MERTMTDTTNDATNDISVSLQPATTGRQEV